ncbi:MAG: hypothetical protein JW814_01675 [Candidatus Krumholzibacteriota bacterium]|nr:hypothetical protein [Candidatus Krumholzibacteriota bacterium]
MIKRVIVSGLLGTLALIILTVLVNGIFGLKSRLDMRPIQNERLVYELLKEEITEPGRYICNPAGNPQTGFPPGEPVFSILYSGFGHEAAGRMMIFGLVLFLLAPMIAASMLSQASERVLSSYWRKVLFFVGIGLLFAVFGDMTRYGIGEYPLKEALTVAGYHILAWTLTGMAVAWRMRPEKDLS